MTLMTILSNLKAGLHEKAIPIDAVRAAIRALEKDRFDYAAAEAEFAKQFDWRSSGENLVLRARRGGSFFPERKTLSAFLKEFLTSKSQSSCWSRTLVCEMRAWLLADANPLQPGELLKSQ